jgi:hypothetical protein
MPNPNLRRPIRSISRNLDSLRDFVDVLDAFLHGKVRDAMEEHTVGLAPLLIAMGKAGIFKQLPRELSMSPDLFENLTTDMAGVAEIEIGPPDERGRRHVDFRGPPSDAFAKAVDALSRATGRTRMLYSSSLMNLTSSVELFFSQLLHEYFTTFPEAVGVKDKVFSLDDLAAFSTVADARSHYILARIEDLLRSQFDDWIHFLKRDVKLSMGYLRGDQPLLSEAFQRRNLVVHNGGIVNSLYLAKVIPPVRSGIELGDDLTPSRAYLNERIDLFETYCVLIGAELWKQIAQADETRAAELNDLAYRHLQAKRYQLTKSFSYFTMFDKLAPESARIPAQLNYWQAEKRLGNWDAVRGEAEAADFSAKSLRFQLGLAALLERNDEFYSLLPKALQSDELSIDELTSFPIMEEVRRDPRYAQYEPSELGSNEVDASATAAASPQRPVSAVDDVVREG